MQPNVNYQQLKDSYLFSDIAHRVGEFQEQNLSADIIRLGIGDVTLPLCAAVTEAMHAAVDEMGEQGSFRGYGPEQGYPFLRKAIHKYYLDRTLPVHEDEIFVSDGAKSDIGNILDLFGGDNRVLVPDPVYPVYVDTNLMAGRTITYMNATEENGFLPLPADDTDADIIYLCSPNNPTGAVYTAEGLKRWVDYAREHEAVILFDAAYEAFITDPELPRSIYEIDGARTCAIEFCSFSKTAGFTGTRCGYTIVPQELEFADMKLRDMWLRRQTTKFNGVAYVVQRGAAAVFTPEGQQQIHRNIDYYRCNASVIAGALDDLGIWYTGGTNSPYIWMKCPDGCASWDFFDRLLHEANVVGTPGVGFGKNGEGFFRLTAFGDQTRTAEAAERIKKMLK